MTSNYWSKRIMDEGCKVPDLVKYSLENLEDPTSFDKFCETLAWYDNTGGAINKRIYGNWDILFERVKSDLTKPTEYTHHNSSEPTVMITFTTCKRFDLFQQTLNSILNTWTDISKVDYWFCVDDNSSDEDRQKMRDNYPWFDFYMKSEDEKGHRASMNIIYDKLKQLQPKYWIHMEDDFLFFKKNAYVSIGMKFLQNPENSMIRQLLFNRAYGETIRDYSTRGFSKTSSDDFVVHEYKEGRNFPYRNCHYWPHYSFRPSIIDAKVILNLGNFDSENQFFEMDYAKVWSSNGYKSAFMNSINCKHIGKLTSEKGTDNAYTLNNENQFNNTSGSEYKFTTTWFAGSELKKNMHKYLEPTQENHILEIGCFEGRSTCHFSDYYLDHPDSTMTCIDPFIGDNGTPQVNGGTRAIFDKNIRLSKHFDKCEIHYGYSDNVLPTIKGKFNFIYIDGSHEPQDILSDMRNTFPFLAKGGIMYMDDYLGGENHEIKKVIDQFINEHKDEVDVIFSGYQLGLKLRNPNYVKVVNLERRPDRKKQIQDQLDNHEITNYEFINAVDGKKLKPTETLRDIFENNDFGSKVGVIGCALSHYGIWKNLLADRVNDFYVVMEDDAELCENFGAYFSKALQECKTRDIVFLSYLMYSKDRNENKHIYNVYQTDTDTPFLDIATLNKQLYVGGTCLYTINKNGAKILCDFIESYGIRHGIDYQMKITPNLDTYESRPLICMSEWNEGGAQIDTDIQCNTGGLDFSSLPQSDNLEKHFIFVPCKDQVGNDMYKRKGTLKQMMKSALDDPKCIAFNTLGFFKDRITDLSESKYFGDADGLYVKKVYRNNSKKRVKMLCNWCDSEQLCKEWSVMCPEGSTWGNIEITHTDEDVDHYVIINFPRQGEYYDVKRTTIFQMEPWVYDNTKDWGVKTWGKWASPDPSVFHRVFTHKNSLNCVQWQFKIPEHISNTERLNKVVCVLSKKIHDDGHSKRVNFVRETEDDDLIHVYGRDNFHNLSNYMGKLTNDSKENEFIKYKYCLSAENNSESNYASEKIWEPILCESLCFYWGCPNLEEYIDHRAFVRLDLDDKEGSMEIIRKAIKEDWWSQRLDIIKQEKQKIMNELGFFPRISKLIEEN